MIFKGLILLLIILSTTYFFVDAPSAIPTGKMYGVNHVEGTQLISFELDGHVGYEQHHRCCASLPPEWSLGGDVLVTWKVTPNFEAFSYSHTQNNSTVISDVQNYQKRVTLPKYDNPCSLKVHFLPCQDVMIIATCYNEGKLETPISEPLDRKEPQSCPL